jgi:hypothetical protein
MKVGKMKNEVFYIEKCRELVEKRLAWGSSKNWQNQDFENLSERILEATEVSLSSSTLKRIWGKVSYNSTPHITTLNALAQFVGYENWRAFTCNDFEAPQSSSIAAAGPLKSKNALFYSRWAWVVLAFVLVVGIGFIVVKGKKTIHYDRVSFSSKPVTLGVPNTVVFDYDVSDSNADSVLIQQSWDPALRTQVDKNEHQFTTTYYLPGYYRAKLLLNDSIVREHDVLIETDGWLGFIDFAPVPMYFSRREVEKNNHVSIEEADILAKGLDLEKELPWVSMIKVNKAEQYPSDNFVFEVELKNTYPKGKGVCQKSRLFFMCQDGMHSIPFSIKGCVGEIELVLGNERQQGRTKDLSAFGVDFQDWVKVRCEVKNQVFKVFIKQELAYQGGFKQKIGNIVGIGASFEGAGMIRNARFVK